MHDGKAKNADCDKTTSMGVFCKGSGEEYVNYDKINGYFYCSLSDIGLMEKQPNGSWKEIKYLLKNCKQQKRAAAPKARDLLTLNFG